MGASVSQPQQVTDDQMMQNIEGKKVMIDKALTDNLVGLNDILTQFGKNDTQGIIDRISKMDEFKGKIPSSVIDKVGTVHKALLDTLDSSLSDADKKQKLETNSAVSNYIQMFVNKDLDSKMKDYLNNPFIKNDPIVQKNMVDVTNSIKTIRGKYKYFEYKYLQMNVFLILFTNHVHNTVKKFIDETAAFYEAREKYHLVLIHNVIKTFQEQLGDETKKLTDLDTGVFTNTIKELTQSMMSSITQQKQLSEKMKQDSLQEILKFLMEREAVFAQQIIKGVDEYKSGHVTTPQGDMAMGPINKPEFIQANEFQGQKTGYAFKVGDKGSGYYLNARAGPSQQPAQQQQYSQYGPNRIDFISAPVFQGVRAGYRYTTGPKGTGYYLESGMRGGFIKGSSVLQSFYDL